MDYPPREKLGIPEGFNSPPGIRAILLPCLTIRHDWGSSGLSKAQREVNSQ